MSSQKAPGDKDLKIEEAVTRLNAKLLGTVFGVLFGLGLFVATNFLVLKGGQVVGPHLALLGQFFPGYTVTFTGSLLGLLYGFVTGFATGALIGAVYNLIAKV